MKFKSTDRSAIFIDGADLYAASRGIGFDVDYRALLEFFQTKTDVLRAFYYVTIVEGEEYSPLKPLTDWLAYNGYTVVTKLVREYSDAGGRRRVKGSMDVELAIDMLELVHRLDHVILLSGNSDFRRLIETVQRRGVRVTVVSSIRTLPPIASDEVRRQADQFVELSEIAPEFTRRLAEVKSKVVTRSMQPVADPLKPLAP